MRLNEFVMKFFNVGTIIIGKFTVLKTNFYKIVHFQSSNLIILIFQIAKFLIF